MKKMTVIVGKRLGFRGTILYLSRFYHMPLSTMSRDEKCIQKYFIFPLLPEFKFSREVIIHVVVPRHPHLPDGEITRRATNATIMMKMTWKTSDRRRESRS